MDGLVKQMRVRFAGVGEDNTEEPSNSLKRRVPIQKSYSFKGEKKKVQNWFQRQFLGQMRGSYDTNDIEHATAVAAVAYAISSLEESNQMRNNEGPESETHLTKSKSKSKKDEDIAISMQGSVIASTTSKGEGSRKGSGDFDVPDRKVQMTSPKDDQKPESLPSMEIRVPTEKKPLNSSTNHKPGSPLPKPAQISNMKPEKSASLKPAQQSIRKPETIPPRSPNTVKPADLPAEIRRMGSTKPATETKADAWERAQIAKIKEKYEKLNATISSWEEKKKAKAKRKLEKEERDIEKRRARVLQHYRTEMESIDQIAGGARAQAQEKRRNEELKAKEKANRIRSTGEIPSSSCLCF